MPACCSVQSGVVCYQQLQHAFLPFIHVSGLHNWVLWKTEVEEGWNLVCNQYVNMPAHNPVLHRTACQHTILLCTVQQLAHNPALHRIACQHPIPLCTGQHATGSTQHHSAQDSMLAHNPTLPGQRAGTQSHSAQGRVLAYNPALCRIECQHTIPLSTLMMIDGMLAHKQDPTPRAHSH